ncbi:MAG: sialidase family protein [Thermoguttaceae bacterium]
MSSPKPSRTHDVGVIVASAAIALALALLSSSGGLGQDRLGPEGQIIARASVQHPRNGEADILPLANGDLLLVYGRWSSDGGKLGSDFGAAELWSKTSHDGGKTWGEDRVVVPNEGKLTTFEAGLLRLPRNGILLSYCVKDSSEDCSICFRKSFDEGRTWSERSRYQIPTTEKYTGYTGQNNARLVRLANGRILLPVFDGYVRGTVLLSFVLYSDDDGKTWKKSGDVDIRKLAPGNTFGAAEPAVVELKDGRVMMLLRTNLGFIAKSYSSDGGKTWSPPVAIKGLVSPNSPASVKRIPQTGDLLLVWNNSNSEERRPLNSAISKDDGETWGHVRCLDADGGCYTSITPLGDRILLTYYHHSASLKLMSVDHRWFNRADANPVSPDRLPSRQRGVSSHKSP